MVAEQEVVSGMRIWDIDPHPLREAYRTAQRLACIVYRIGSVILFGSV
jgi:hypothetical protein